MARHIAGIFYLCLLSVWFGYLEPAQGVGETDETHVLGEKRNPTATSQTSAPIRERFLLLIWRSSDRQLYSCLPDNGQRRGVWVLGC